MTCRPRWDLEENAQSLSLIRYTRVVECKGYDVRFRFLIFICFVVSTLHAKWLYNYFEHSEEEKVSRSIDDMILRNYYYYAQNMYFMIMPVPVVLSPYSNLDIPFVTHLLNVY